VFRPRYTCESQIITVCQETADYLYEEGGIDAIIIDFCKVFNLVSHDRLCMRLAALGIDSRSGVGHGNS
jgi:hypothetical protein